MNKLEQPEKSPADMEAPLPSPAVFLLTVGEGQANTPLVFVAIIMLSLIGIGAYFAVELLERRVLHYLPKSSN